MTRNQIDWQNMLISGKRQGEEARHNLVVERETQRSNKAGEFLKNRDIEAKLATLKEARRHNKMSEYLEDFKNQEVKRHNDMSETQNQLNIDLQHYDRNKANDVQRAFNDLSLAIRDMERLDIKDYRTDSISLEARKVVNNYDVALKNWSNAVRNTELVAERNPSLIATTKAQGFESTTRGFKNVADTASTIVKTAGQLLGMFTKN